MLDKGKVPQNLQLTLRNPKISSTKFHELVLDFFMFHYVSFMVQVLPFLWRSNLLTVVIHVQMFITKIFPFYVIRLLDITLCNKLITVCVCVCVCAAQMGGWGVRYPDLFVPLTHFSSWSRLDLDFLLGAILRAHTLSLAPSHTHTHTH